MQDFRPAEIREAWRANGAEIGRLLVWSLWLAFSGLGLIYGYFVEFDLGRGCIAYIETSKTVNPVQAGRICTYFIPFTGVLLFWISSAAGMWRLLTVFR